MKAYVNCITSGAELRSDIKVLIPEMNLRRRMSRVVKSAWPPGIGIGCWNSAHGQPIDAIITATGLGCIADSEKFLDGLIAGNETMLNPTPFIQSTFNTVGRADRPAARTALLQHHLRPPLDEFRKRAYGRRTAHRARAGRRPCWSAHSTRRRPRSRRFCSGSASHRRGRGANRRYSSC